MSYSDGSGCVADCARLGAILEQSRTRVGGKQEAGEDNPGQGPNQRLKLDKQTTCPEEPRVQRANSSTTTPSPSLLERENSEAWYVCLLLLP